MSAKITIVGDGWAALGAVGFLVQQNQPVVWVAGTGTRMLSAAPSMEAGAGVELLQRLARGFGIETGEAITGSFLREFRNKAFRQPSWTKAPTPETRVEARKEVLWGPECGLVPVFEARFELTLNELEEKIRALLLGDSEEGAQWRKLIRRVEGLPLASIQLDDQQQVTGVTLVSGEEIICAQVIYADLWSSLPSVQGLPKNLAFIRGREPTSVLQATMTHPTPVGVGLMEGFFGTLHREVGEDMDRHIWGHFSADGLKSYWTLGMNEDEIEDNHLIAKKFRRLKSALDKMFTGETWVPAGMTEFMNNVSSEQVRFVESVVFAEGKVSFEPVKMPQARGVLFVTDGYGISCALAQVGAALELPVATESVTRADSEGSSPEAEGMNTENPSAS